MSAYQNYTEEQLITYLKNGDHAAFTEIFNRYWEMLADAAYCRLNSREDAEEVVQSVFVSLYVRREELNLKNNLAGYLKTALKYKVIDIYRLQQKHYMHLNSVVQSNNLSLPTPGEHLEYKELESSILQVANNLPVKCKEVFLMSRFEQLSHQEIAEKTGSSISTIKKHIHKALSILKKTINPYQTILILTSALFSYK